MQDIPVSVQAMHQVVQAASQERDFTFATRARVLSLAFPRSAQNNRPQVLGDAAEMGYFVIGHIANYPRQGVTKLTTAMPEVTRYLNAWLQMQFPQQSWSSIAISHNEQACVHVDAANLQGSWGISGRGLVVGITKWKGFAARARWQTVTRLCCVHAPPAFGVLCCSPSCHRAIHR